jgi:hypothetical protein
MDIYATNASDVRPAAIQGSLLGGLEVHGLFARDCTLHLNVIYVSVKLYFMSVCVFHKQIL